MSNCQADRNFSPEETFANRPLLRVTVGERDFSKGWFLPSLFTFLLGCSMQPLSTLPSPFQMRYGAKAEKGKVGWEWEGQSGVGWEG